MDGRSECNSMQPLTMSITVAMSRAKLTFYSYGAPLSEVFTGNSILPVASSASDSCSCAVLLTELKSTVP